VLLKYGNQSENLFSISMVIILNALLNQQKSCFKIEINKHNLFIFTYWFVQKQQIFPQNL